MPFVSQNPTTEAIEATFPCLPPAELAALLDHLPERDRAWRATPIGERARLLRALAAELRARAEEAADRMAREMGKPLADGRSEIEKCAWVCEHYADVGPGLLATERVDTDAARSYVVAEPLGTILAVMPWNFPFWQLFRFAAPALVAGNSVLVKPAPGVPLCGLLIQELFDAVCRAPAPLVTAFAEVEQIESIVAHPAIRGVTLTGSDRAGSSLGALAGRHLKKAVLELGGSDPFIVLDDVDVAEVAGEAVRARLVNGGQSCIAAKRFIVLPGIADAFVAAMAEELSRVVVGDPREPGTQVGPLARRDLREALHRQVRESVAEGAALVTGGGALPRPGWFYAPTLLDRCTADLPAGAEETFGPLAAVLRARDEDDALRLANATPFGLGAAVWTADARRADGWIDRLEAGCVFVNGIVKSDPRLPFGGGKRSGHGRELGRIGLSEFVHWKSVWIGPASRGRV